MQLLFSLLDHSLPTTTSDAKVHYCSQSPLCMLPHKPLLFYEGAPHKVMLKHLLCFVVQNGSAGQQRVNSLKGQGLAGCTVHRRHALARAASRDLAEQEASSSSTGGRESAPWLLGFQCNERYLQWDESAQVDLCCSVLCVHLPS